MRAQKQGGCLKRRRTRVTFKSQLASVLHLIGWEGAAFRHLFSITAYLCGVAIDYGLVVQQANRFACTLGNSEEFEWGDVKIFLHQETPPPPPHVQKILRRLCIFLSGILLGPKTNLKTSNQDKYKWMNRLINKRFWIGGTALHLKRWNFSHSICYFQ